MNELADLLADLVAIDSVNPDLVSGGAGEAQIADFIAAWGRAADLEVHVQEAAPGRPNVILIARGSGGGRSLMLNAHTDTVGAAGMDDPFGARIQGGRMFGRGAYDMKSGLAAIMLSLKAAQGLSLSGDVIVSAVVDEEYGSIGTEALLADWERWRADAVVIAEPTELAISIAHRGFVWADIEVFGVAAHGSRPHLGVDAIVKMGKVLRALDEHDRQLRAHASHDLLGGGSLHASIIQGGDEISVVPAYCKLVIERRTIPGETRESVQAELQALLDEIAAGDDEFRARCQATFSRSPFGIAADDPLLQMLSSAAESSLGESAPLIGSSWWMDAALFADKGISTAVLGPIGAGAHAAEEWVDLASAARCVEIYTNLIRDFCR